LNREEISSKLALISPCLGKQDFVEILKHVCFKDDQITSFNGTQAAIIDCKLEFDCTVDGSLLQKLVNSYSIADIELKQGKDSLTLSCGKSKVKLNTLSSDDFVFELPEDSSAESEIKIDADFVFGISKCLISVSDNFIEKSQSGITVDAHSGGVFLYSTDDVCLSKYITKQECEKSAKVILPKLFCTQLASWQKALGDGVLAIGLDYVKAEFSEGKAILFSKIDPEDEFLDFEDVIAQSYYEDTVTIDIPEKLEEILQRCSLITSSKMEQFVTIGLGKNSINLLAEGKNGVHKITDKIRVRGIDGDCSFEMDCNLLLRGIGHVGKMTFNTENPADIDTILFVGQSDNFLHLINSR
jgi:DNA polymerase III sliding clamp (beta) subunit (PCNA family)